MIDRKFVDHARFVSAVGLRLDDVENRIEEVPPGGSVRIGRQGRAFFLHVVEGHMRLERHGFSPVSLGPEEFLGLEKGPDARLVNASTKHAARLLVSSIGHQHAFIRQLPGDVLIVRHDEAPWGPLMASSTALLAEVLDGATPELAITRRLCEIIMLQLLRYVQAQSFDDRQTPSQIRHDPYLIRAWAAFYADPGSRWTIADLADVAGLGRSAFIARFKAAFGLPPQQALTRMRMEQAEYLLGASDAPLSRIAEDVGYASEAAFIRAFQRHAGTTPGAFRASREASRNSHL